jgi:hypothetical protein
MQYTKTCETLSCNSYKALGDLTKCHNFCETGEMSKCLHTDLARCLLALSTDLTACLQVSITMKSSFVAVY